MEKNKPCLSTTFLAGRSRLLADKTVNFRTVSLKHRGWVTLVQTKLGWC